MAKHEVKGVCPICEHEFEEMELAYYLAPCKLTKDGVRGYGVTQMVMRIVFFGGVRKDRQVVCMSCYETMFPYKG